MKSITVEAATINEAISVALKKLNTTKDKVEISVLREEKKGLFNMQGAQLAKILVKINKKI